MIEHSISPEGVTLKSMQVTMHRFVLAEFNTHKMISKSFRSSRAVPVAKLLAEVRENPAMPVVWLQNQKGMQGGAVMGDNQRAECEWIWRKAAVSAADHAEVLMHKGLHKGWANRLLEPYLYVHGIVTATDLENFYALRCHEDAQPEIRVLAEAMRACERASTPKMLQPGEWHLPYVTAEDRREAYNGPSQSYSWGMLRAISAARCARVSYRLHDGSMPSIDADLALYEALVGSTPAHASPCEHQGTPDEYLGNYRNSEWRRQELHGNFRGFIQARKLLPNEYVPG
jgi:hypothetical protein